MIYHTENTKKILSLLTVSPNPLTQTQIQIKLYGKITPSTRVTTHRVIKKLLKNGIITKKTGQTYTITPTE